MSTSLNLSSLFPTQSTNPAFRIASLSTSLGDIRARLSWKNASLKFVLLCLLWYLSSAMSNNSAKQILMTFKYPVTLTFVQFGFISGWCLLLAVIQKFRGPNRRALFGARYGIQIPTIAIIISTLPLSLFQIAGHVFGSLATSQIPVSVVHTVKVRNSCVTVIDLGLIAFIHGLDVPIHVQCPVFSVDISITPPFNARRHARLLIRTLRQYCRSILRARLNACVREPKHIH